MNNIITANELKTKGVSAISKASSESAEVLITVRGKTEYVVLPVKMYNYFRECELDIAFLESRNDLKKGKYIEESVEKHIKRISHG